MANSEQVADNNRAEKKGSVKTKGEGKQLDSSIRRSVTGLSGCVSFGTSRGNAQKFNESLHSAVRSLGVVREREEANV